MTNDDVNIDNDRDIIRDEKVLVDFFNENHINTVEIYKYFKKL